MPRAPRIAPGGMVFHVLNRSNARMQIFDDDEDYAAFERVLADAQKRVALRILGYCVMPNHWHLVVWPRRDEDLATFMQWMTVTHVRRWHTHRHSEGSGHLYQGRYKSFPIQEDTHLLTVLRYVERNPLRAKLVERAEEWRWSSLWRHRYPRAQKERPVLADWPIPRRRNWTRFVNQPLTDAELQDLRTCAQRGRPFGNTGWREITARNLDLGSTFRPRGRPLKKRD